MKEIKDNTNRSKGITCSWIGRINIVKITITLKAINRFNVIPIKFPMTFFYKTGSKIFKLLWKHKRSQTVKIILKNKNGAGGIIVSDFRLLQNYSNQNSTYCYIKSRIYGQLTYNKGCRNIQWRKTVPSMSGIGKLDSLHLKE